ncbi:MAG: Em GEA1 (EM1) [Candidatus Bathyarchaeota archaeon]|nr:Em GEA1 (EM1) [Candidatus Bathyarchaeota archaeon]
MEVTELSNKQKDEDMNSTDKGKMTVQEAGRRGGAKGGPRVRELIEEGKAYEEG